MLIDSDKGEDIEEVEAVGVERETHFMSMTIAELEKRKAEVRVGFMCMNLYEPPPEATWGIYNDRKINETWVNDLVGYFKNRCDNCTDDDCIEIAIRPEWLKNRDAVCNDRLMK
jgi:hypothetical protein